MWTESEINAYTAWLETTLLPDLTEAGQEGAARDIELCLSLINHLRGK
jgi:hypothetical protein